MNIEVIIERKFKIKISLVERERSWGNYVINFGYNDIEVLVERFDVDKIKIFEFRSRFLVYEKNIEVFKLY